ncbi:MAG TPA: LysE family translocator [Roseiarcus sp.]|nr:LysE family translocator [Roseiarcus sp.]
MSLSSLFLFAGVYAVAVATPGPGVAAVVARVLARGLSGVAFFIAGFVVGDLIWFAVAATGLAVLAHQFAALFTLIRFAGVLYLLWLAWRIWRAPAGAGEQAVAASDRGARLFFGALSLTLGNPKVIVFFLSIMPLVVDIHAMNAEAFAAIAITMPLVLAPVLAGYALAANRARALFRSPRAMKIVNRSAAGVMAGVAIAVATR